MLDRGDYRLFIESDRRRLGKPSTALCIFKKKTIFPFFSFSLFFLKKRRKTNQLKRLLHLHPLQSNSFSTNILRLNLNFCLFFFFFFLRAFQVERTYTFVFLLRYFDCNLSDSRFHVIKKKKRHSRPDAKGRSWISLKSTLFLNWSVDILKIEFEIASFYRDTSQRHSTASSSSSLIYIYTHHLSIFLGILRLRFFIR